MRNATAPISFPSSYKEEVIHEVRTAIEHLQAAVRELQERASRSEGLAEDQRAEVAAELLDLSAKIAEVERKLERSRPANTKSA